MEFFSVFVSVVLVCVVSAGIPHDGIHWTYTGRPFDFRSSYKVCLGGFKNLFCYAKKKKKRPKMNLMKGV